VPAHNAAHVCSKARLQMVASSLQHVIESKHVDVQRLL
jgi:hypothetical protein